MSVPGPILVAVIDISEPLSDLDCTRSAGPPYREVWLLVCQGGRPLGSVQLTTDGPSIKAAVLERELRAKLGDVSSVDPVNVTAELARASVVVPTALSRPEQLRRCVTRLTELDHPDFEVIVVDNRREGAPIELPGVRVVREPRPGISAARNRGLAVADGEIVAFTDDDVEVDPRWLRAIGERFARESDLAAVTGLVVPAALDTPAQIFFEQSGSGLDRGYEALTFERDGRFRIRRRSTEDGSERVHSMYKTGELGLGSNMAFRASVLRAMGGFDVALGTGTPTHGGEDLAMLMELIAEGYRLAYEPRAIVHHTHRATLDDLERQIHGYGVGFTAMLTAITLRNPRHAFGLASVLPEWVRSLRDPSCGKRSQRGDAYPAGLGRAELRGMLAGPVAYLRARRMQRRWAA
ncbi:MAG TPA: glycosyltransferase [Solirubrobacteraceae bacterium]|nr:glycosyltransferase [Solirubrobacteraceae bacterium]